MVVYSSTPWPMANATLEDLRALPSGLVEQMGVGSRLTRFNERPDTPTGFIVHQPGIALSSLTHNFSARNLFGPQGRINTDGASVDWSFGDGGTGRGLATAHNYARAGRYVVTADVTLADRRHGAPAQDHCGGAARTRGQSPLSAPSPIMFV